MKCNHVQFTGLTLLLGCLVGLLLPAFHSCGGCRRTAACANNLSQLYKLATVYASTHKGEWPATHGEDLWLSLTRTVPPLIEADHLSVFACPLNDEDCAPGETHYRGPRLPYAKLGPSDPIAADKEGNHGEDGSINVLFKDGRVEEAYRGDPLWRKCQDLLRP